MTMTRREALGVFGLLATVRWRLGGTEVSNEMAALPGDVTWHNVAAIEAAPEGDGWRLSRLPETLREAVNPQARRRAFSPAGVEWRFNFTGDEARIVLKFIESDRGEPARGLPVLAEIYFGDRLARCEVVGTEWTEIVIKRPKNAAALAAAARSQPGRFDPELVRVVLPYIPEVRVRGIEGAFTAARPEQLPRRRYLAYGSSITNGAFAARPGDLYPARVAAALGVDGINLGFGGGAWLEPEMADWIASRDDWDFATLEMGINLTSRMTPEEFRAQVANFLPRIARAHADKWIFCIDLFTGRGDFSSKSNFPAFREIVREAVRELDLPRLVHLDGRELLTRESGLTADLLHPSSDGFVEIAERLTAAMRARLG
jgi:Lysophospholipase L1 and related esterases